MNKKKWNEGLNHIDSDLVEEFVEKSEKLEKKKKRQSVLFRLGALAACFCLIVSAVLALPVLRGYMPGFPDMPTLSTAEPTQSEDAPGIPENPTTQPTKGVDIPGIPVWEGAAYTAEEIASLFSARVSDTSGTNAYTLVCTPDSKYLYIDALPDAEYLGVYQYSADTASLDEAEFETFVSGYLPKMTDALNVNMPDYKPEESRYELLMFWSKLGEYNMTATQGYRQHHVSLSNINGDRTIKLGGEVVRIDQRLSDDEILSSLQSVKNKLSDIFGADFTEGKVVREFDSYSKHGVHSVDVYFYNTSPHNWKLMRDIPVTEYIQIHFDNILNYEGDIVSDTVLQDAVVWYYESRREVEEEYAHIADASRISVEEAEELLLKGYVFGGHACSLCMESQDKISFEDYAYVDIEYVYGYDQASGQKTVGIPFYAFYKQVGTAYENGNIIYAKTYVPAIKVSGYEEYFQGQLKYHRSGGV